MIHLFSESKKFNPNLKAFVVLSKPSPNPFLSHKITAFKEYIESKKIKDLRLCASVLYQREVYQNSFSQGLGIVEVCQKGSRALQDFNGFFKELIQFARSKNAKTSKIG